MKQLVQSVKSGELQLIETPDPVVGPTEVLVQTAFSIVSAGTERAARSLASANLLQKAKARPDLVRQTVRRARTAGVKSTVQIVRSRLDEVMPLGYAGAGTVVQVGEAVEQVRPGMRVATGGAGHSELQVVSGLLAVPVDDGVELSEAAFATLGAIALQGLRVADVSVGSRIVVIGLGLIGQLTARLAMASGMQVAGIDLRPWTVEVASRSGVFAHVEDGEATTEAIQEWSRGVGADAVILTAATASSEPARRATSLARDRGSIVVVGDVGLDLDRTPFYEKELSLRFARSYGPGRYERSYEEWAVDYPIGHVRWTEGRNLSTFLGLLSAGTLQVADLITHRYAFEAAPDAYRTLGDPEAAYLGIELVYPELRPTRTRTAPPIRIRAGEGVGLIGAGNFAKGVLVPAMKKAGLSNFVAVASASGLSASRLAETTPFSRVGQSAEDVIAADDVDIVVIASSHDTHANLVTDSLKAGKHVFCEKPLALTVDELIQVTSAWRENGHHLMVGFNRRHSPSIERCRAILGEDGGPLGITIRVNADKLPAKHWYNDRRQGGRILGEICHFVDTASALTNCDVVRVAAFGSGSREALLEDHLGVLVSYSDGSVANILYTPSGHPSMPKERIEILGRGHGLVIDDFSSLTVDGRTERMPGGQDKGHSAQFTSFRQACRLGGDVVATERALNSMGATLAVVTAIVEGSPVDVADAFVA